MKALTLTQPWATLVAMGAKRIETRSWRVSYRGRILIHAAASMPGECRNFAVGTAFDDLEVEAQRLGVSNVLDPAVLPRGAIVASAKLIDCLPTMDARIQRLLRIGPERRYGDYSEGRWAWLFEDVERMEPPVPAKGSLGLWESGL